MNKQTGKQTYVYTVASIPQYIQVKQGETYKIMHVKTINSYGKVIVK
jgi:hypothetical protein